MIEEHRNSTVC